MVVSLFISVVRKPTLRGTMSPCNQTITGVQAWSGQFFGGFLVQGSTPFLISKRFVYFIPDFEHFPAIVALFLADLSFPTVFSLFQIHFINYFDRQQQNFLLNGNLVMYFSFVTEIFEKERWITRKIVILPLPGDLSFPVVFFSFRFIFAKGFTKIFGLN